MAAPATSSVRHRAGATEIQEYEFIDFSIPDEDLSTITLGQVLGLRGSDTIINDDRDDAALLTKHKSPITMTGGISSSREYSRRHQDADRQNRAESRNPSWLQSFQLSIRRSMETLLVLARDHNPFSTSGRGHIRNFVLRSGPAYQLPESNTAARNTKWPTGWRMGALLNMALLAACLLAETIMLIVAVALDKGGPSSTRDGIIYSGDCQITQRWRLAASVFVNIVATITIGSSNYMMQCFSAPTGSELRRAHDNGDFLRVGVSSPLNIEFVSRTKTAMWWLMGIMSVPIHLLFNSAFYPTLQANNYAIALFTSDYNNTELWDSCSDANEESSWSDLTCQFYHNHTQYKQINSSTCIQRYSDPVLVQYSNVILVTSLSSTQRNETLQRLWSHEVSLEDSTLNFTQNYAANGSGSKTDDTTVDHLANLEGLLGIFTAFDYGNWNDDYRKHYQWTLGASDLRGTVANATFLNKTVVTDLEQKLVNSTLQDGDQLIVELSDRSRLLAMVSNSTVPNSIVLNGTAFNRGVLAPLRPPFDPTSWLCNDNSTSSCSRDIALTESSTVWQVSPYGIPIDHCLSQEVDNEQCELRYSMAILVIVIGCDVLKILIIAWALHSNDKPLVTIGDVLEYFMQHREPLTKKRCLMSVLEAKPDAASISKKLSDLDGEPCWSESCFPIDFSNELTARITKAELMGKSIQEIFLNALPKTWQVRKLRWFHAVSIVGWTYLCFVVACALGATASVFATGFVKLERNGGGSIWGRGFESPDPNAVFTATSDPDTDSAGVFILQVLIINSPQLFFSLIYFTYNATFTLMHSAEEWTGFVTERKPLRVSDPKPGQRSSYWLNLPWSYSIPLVVVSALLHWMVSRSLYLVNIKVLGPFGTVQKTRTIFACGYSPIFMLLILVLLFIMMATISGFSMRPLRGNIPLIGANSLAISAVCHNPDFSEAEVCRPLLWGATKQAEGDEPGHCALSSAEVEKPLVGKKYW